MEVDHLPIPRPRRYTVRYAGGLAVPAMRAEGPGVVRYIVSARGIVHRWGHCGCRFGRIITVHPDEEVVGWLYWTPCRKCKP